MSQRFSAYRKGKNTRGMRSGTRVLLHIQENPESLLERWQRRGKYDGRTLKPPLVHVKELTGGKNQESDR